jgi:hypothetical protein
MITRDDILYGVLLPAGLAGMIVLAGGLLGRKAFRIGRGFVPMAVGFGFAGGYMGLLRLPPIPPLDALGWLFYAAIGVGILGAIDAWLWGARQPAVDPCSSLHTRSDTGGRSTSAPPALLSPAEPAWVGGWSGLIRPVAVLGFSVLLVWLLTRPLLVYHWIGRDGPLWIGGIAGVMLLLWWILDRLAVHAPGSVLPFVLAGVAGISAAVMGMSGSVKIAQMGGMLAASLAAVAIVGGLFPHLASGRGLAMVFVLLHTSLVASASEHIYANLTSVHAVLLLAAAPLAWLGVLVPARQRALRAAVQLAAALAAAAVAAILAVLAFQQASNGLPGLPVLIADPPPFVYGSGLGGRLPCTVGRVAGLADKFRSTTFRSTDSVRMPGFRPRESRLREVRESRLCPASSCSSSSCCGWPAPPVRP